MRYKIILFFVLISFVLAFTDFGNGTCECYNCTDCGNALLSSSCRYITLANNITSSSSICIGLESPIYDKILDCKGYWIMAEGSYESIDFEGNNITIMNCEINNSAYLRFNNSRIINTTFANTTATLLRDIVIEGNNNTIDCSSNWLVKGKMKLDVKNSENITIKDCKLYLVSNIGENLFNIENAKNVTIENLEIHWDYYLSLSFGGDDLKLHNIKVFWEGPYSPYTADFPIEFYNCSNCIISEFTIANLDGTLLNIKLYNPQNTNLTFVNRSTISLYDGKNVIISDSSKISVNVYTNAGISLLLENSNVENLYFDYQIKYSNITVRNNTIETVRIMHNSQENASILFENNTISGYFRMELPFGNLTITNNTISYLWTEKYDDYSPSGNIVVEHNKFTGCPVIENYISDFYSSWFGGPFVFENNYYFDKKIIFINSSSVISNENIALLTIYNATDVYINDSNVTVVGDSSIDKFIRLSNNVVFTKSNIKFCTSRSWIEDSNNIAFKENLIDGPGIMLYLEDSGNITFYKNTFNDSGIYLYGNVSNLNVTSNLFELRTVYGVRDSGSCSCSNVIIKSNVVTINYSLLTDYIGGFSVCNATVSENNIKSVKMSPDNVAGIACWKNCLIEDNTIEYTTLGIALLNNSVVRNNRINALQYSFYIAGIGNLIYNNYINGSVHLESSSLSNFWNITKTSGTNSGTNIVGGPYLGGNFWVGYSESCTDNNNDGICDDPYVIDANNVDYLPLTYFEAAGGEEESKNLPTSINLTNYAFLVSKKSYNVKGIITFGSFENILGFVLGYGNPTYYAVIFTKNGVGIYSCSSTECSLQYRKDTSIRNGIFMIIYDGTNLKVYNTGRLIISRSISIPSGNIGIVCDRCSLGLVGILSS